VGSERERGSSGLCGSAPQFWDAPTPEAERPVPFPDGRSRCAPAAFLSIPGPEVRPRLPCLWLTAPGLGLVYTWLPVRMTPSVRLRLTGRHVRALDCEICGRLL